jgi:hypothetical protein
MRSTSIFRLAAPALVVVAYAAYGQALLVDRSLGADQRGAAPLGVSRGFLGDHFQVGSRGEDWVIDRLAVWAVADPSARVADASASAALRFGDLYEGIKLFGGIEAPLPIPAGCTCDKVVALQWGNLQPGADAVDNARIRITPATPGSWQVEFSDLKWSVLGGMPIQFGVLATGRPAGVSGERYAWLNHAFIGSRRAAEDQGAHDLRLFDENGNQLGRFAPNGLPLSPSVGMNVQVWGHRAALIAIHPSGSLWEVRLRTGDGFHPEAADPESLRFGPGRASPVMVAPAFDGAAESLVMQFRPEETSIRRGEVFACLTGNLRDGTPFEGCDLVPKQ